LQNTSELSEDPLSLQEGFYPASLETTESSKTEVSPELIARITEYVKKELTETKPESRGSTTPVKLHALPENPSASDARFQYNDQGELLKISLTAEDRVKVSEAAERLHRVDSSSFHTRTKYTGHIEPPENPLPVEETIKDEPPLNPQELEKHIANMMNTWQETIVAGKTLYVNIWDEKLTQWERPNGFITRLPQRSKTTQQVTTIGQDREDGKKDAISGSRSGVSGKDL